MKQKDRGDENRYEDMVSMPHHVSKKHPHMKHSDRAAQFAPFAALSGHREAVRRTEKRVEDSYSAETDNDKEPF